jgi:ABC-type transporter Mla subunit MlaD
LRRLAALGALAVSGAWILLAGPAAPSGGAGDAVRVDALFHNAANVVAGEDVKIAGVAAGIVESVELTDERLALIRMKVDAPFAPFQADARCEVRAQSLIGERFVQCDPGTPEAGPLQAPDGGTPTVPAEQNSAPIDLDLVFNVLRGPYRERLAIVLNELGAGLSGRGEDLNAIIRSANPALADARDLLDTLNGQRAQLSSGIADTDRVLAPIAARPASLERFIREAGSVSERFGRPRDALGESVARLPGLLAEAEPALRELDALSIEALPVLRNLRRAAPSATGLATELRPLARVARPTLRRLGETAVTGRDSLEQSQPFVGSLRRTLEGLRPIAPTARGLVTSLVDSGGTEGYVRFFYNAALATSRFDGTSHILPAHLVEGLCGLYNEGDSPVEGCNGRFDAAAAALGGAGLGNRTGLPGRGGAAPQGAPAPGGASPTDPALPSLPKVPSLPKLPSLPSLPAPGPNQPSGQGGPGLVNGLLDFLLGP